ncbi:MAG: hypothetical protein ACW97Z_04045 [Candidatus Hodarchaeales archaeon]|jgi:hypothetical protein
MKQIIDQIRSTVTFCGFELEAISSHQKYVSIELRSKKRFRKKNYTLGVSKTLAGLLAAERELSRVSKNQILLLDPINNLMEPTLSKKIKLFHDFDQLQVFLNE